MFVPEQKQIVRVHSCKHHFCHPGDMLLHHGNQLDMRAALKIIFIDIVRFLFQCVCDAMRRVSCA